jgi:hypothetical protein
MRPARRIPTGLISTQISPILPMRSQDTMTTKLMNQIDKIASRVAVIVAVASVVLTVASFLSL